MIKFILYNYNYNYNIMERICYYFNKYKDICQNDEKSIWYLGNLDKVWRPLNTEMYTNEEFYKNINIDNIDNIKFIMSNLNLTNLTYGFDVNNLACKNTDGEYKTGTLDSIFYSILKTLDIEPIYNKNILDIENLLIQIDLKIGFRIIFPTIFNYSTQYVSSSRGLITFKNLISLYYVILIVYTSKSLLINKSIQDITLLEIGAGTGWTAYWALQFNFKNYTIVDIPTTNIIQSHFLINSIGDNNVWLYGENENDAFVKIIPSSSFKDLNKKYDIIINFDGIVEYGYDLAINYVNLSREKTNLLSTLLIFANIFSFIISLSLYPN